MLEINTMKSAVSTATTHQIQLAFEQALTLAARYAGATSPNPCVGAAALDSSGKILTVQAHERAGEGHAEAGVISELVASGALSHAETLVVTLEPCNHRGRTGPCTEAILQAGFRRVIYGAKDPNPRVLGGGAERLRAGGIEVWGPEALAGTDIPKNCAHLIRSFSHWSRTGLPWVTVKTAYDANGSMIPPPGRKTFTSPDSLKLAHELRKRADAILTGSGTVLADQPEFTVRHVPDHPGKIRWLALMDRRGRVPEEFITRSKQNGFKIYRGADILETLRFLGSEGVLEVLVEAGPELSRAVIEGGFWNEHVLIQQHPVSPDRNSQMDHVETRLKASGND